MKQYKKEEVQFCIDHGREVAENYDLYVYAPDINKAAVSKRSVDDLIWILTQYLQKNFRIWEVEIQKSSIKSAFQANADGSFDIYLLQGMETDERRFVLCKELFHIVLDQPQCQSMDIYGHLVEVTTTFSKQTSPNQPAAWEKLAEAAAMEFLFPYHKRREFVAGAGPDPYYGGIAAQFGIPQQYVEEYCTEASMEYFKDLHRD